MNKVILIGRLCTAPEVRYSQGNERMAIARYRLAVDRKFKRDGEPSADFISCVAFGTAAEFAEKYLAKGSKIELAGKIKTGSYTNKNGEKVYYTEVLATELNFGESKAEKEARENGAEPAPASSDGFMNIPDGIDEELPFN